MEFKKKKNAFFKADGFNGGIRVELVNFKHGRNSTKNSAARACQMILVPDVAERKSCHIKHVPMERLYSPPPPPLFFQSSKGRVSRLKLLWGRMLPFPQKK